MSGSDKVRVYEEVVKQLDAFFAKYDVDAVGRMATIRSASVQAFANGSHFDSKCFEQAHQPYVAHSLLCCFTALF